MNASAPKLVLVKSMEPEKERFFKKATLMLRALERGAVLENGGSLGVVSISSGKIRKEAAEYFEKAGMLDRAKFEYLRAARDLIVEAEDMVKKCKDGSDIIREREVHQVIKDVHECLRKGGRKGNKIGHLLRITNV
jgi:hypothetical protein